MPGEVRSRTKKEASPSAKEGSSGDRTRSSRLSFDAVVTLLIFSTAMCTLPLGTYFLIHRYIISSTTVAAMGAIVMVQMIVAIYIYKAWHDETNEHEYDVKRDKSKTQ